MSYCQLDHFCVCTHLYRKPSMSLLVWFMIGCLMCAVAVRFLRRKKAAAQPKYAEHHAREIKSILCFSAKYVTPI